MATANQSFEFEENCRRLAKRYPHGLSVQYQGQELNLRNWSATGCLLAAQTLDPQEPLMLEIPCSDGIVAFCTHFKLIRTGKDGVAVQFIFDNPMDAAVLAAHAKNVETGEPGSKEQLLKAGRPVYMDELHQQARATEAHRSRWGRLIPFMVTVVIILAIAAIVIPNVRSQLAMKIGEQQRYTNLAINRLEAARLQHETLVRKMDNAKKIIEKTPIPLTMEQLTLFELGIEQIKGEIDLQTVNIQMLEANLKEVKKGNFFYEKEALGPFSTQFRADSAPFLTQLLAEIATESRLYPKTPHDILSYQQVARQRYDNALAELETNKAKLVMLQEFEKRYNGLVAKGALAQNALLFLQRDQQMLLIEQQRLGTTVALLEQNWKNTLEGNFTLETRLLEKFTPSPNPPPTTFDYNFIR